MKAPYPGKCLCGAVQFRLTEEPLTLYACHCTDCQKRSGSAFGLSLWVHRAAIQVIEGRPELNESAPEDGRVRQRRICAKCATQLWSEPKLRPEISVVRAGTLLDTSWLRPVAHVWTRSAQPWFAFPEGVARYDTQPADFSELMVLWKKREWSGD